MGSQHEGLSAAGSRLLPERLCRLPHGLPHSVRDQRATPAGDLRIHLRFDRDDLQGRLPEPPTDAVQSLHREANRAVDQRARDGAGQRPLREARVDRPALQRAQRCPSGERVVSQGGAPRDLVGAGRQGSDVRADGGPRRADERGDAEDPSETDSPTVQRGFLEWRREDPCLLRAHSRIDVAVTAPTATIACVTLSPKPTREP